MSLTRDEVMQMDVTRDDGAPVPDLFANRVLDLIAERDEAVALLEGAYWETPEQRDECDAFLAKVKPR